MSQYSEKYKGYTITLLGTRWYISGFSYVDFSSLQFARKYIDKVKP